MVTQPMEKSNLTLPSTAVEALSEVPEVPALSQSAQMFPFAIWVTRKTGSSGGQISWDAIKEQCPSVTEGSLVLCNDGQFTILNNTGLALITSMVMSYDRESNAWTPIEGSVVEGNDPAKGVREFMAIMLALFPDGTFAPFRAGFSGMRERCYRALTLAIEATTKPTWATTYKNRPELLALFPKFRAIVTRIDIKQETTRQGLVIYPPTLRIGPPAIEHFNSMKAWLTAGCPGLETGQSALREQMFRLNGNQEVPVYEKPDVPF